MGNKPVNKSVEANLDNIAMWTKNNLMQLNATTWFSAVHTYNSLPDYLSMTRRWTELRSPSFRACKSHRIYLGKKNGKKPSKDKGD